MLLRRALNKYYGLNICFLLRYGKTANKNVHFFSSRNIAAKRVE